MISTTIIGIGVFSINKTEEVYYNGFVEEMLNTISSFGLNIENIKEEDVHADDIFNVDKNLINKDVFLKQVQSLLLKLHQSYR